jgi:ABC-type multidrug transport system ATPase subunit
MKRRLSLAIANLNDPDIFLLDEPFNGLDSEFQEKFTNLVRDKIHDGAVAIISSHNIELMKPLANRWVNLNNGQLSEQQEGGVAL